MSFSSSSTCRRFFQHIVSPGRVPQNTERRRTRLLLEVLEDRSLLSVNWINPSGGDWDTPANWSSGTVPGSGDDVVINVPGATITHSANVADAVHSLTSADPIALSGGSLSLGADSSISADFSLTAKAALTGTGNLTIGGLFTWQAATLGVSGSVTANGGMAIGVTSVGDLRLDGTTLNNAGAATMSSTVSSEAYMEAGDNAVINNLSGATWDMHNGAYATGIRTNGYLSGNLTFNNLGTLTQSSSTSEILIDGSFNNSGAVDDKAGLLALGTSTATATSSGSFLGEAGTSLLFEGPQTLTSSSSITGDLVRFNYDNGSAATVAGSYAANSTNVAEGSGVTFTGSVSSIGSLYIEHATANFSPSAGPVTFTLASLSLLNAGALVGTDSFVVGGLFTWQASTLGTSGALTANGGMAITITDVGDLRLNGTTLNNAGAATLTATLPDEAYLEAGNNAVIDNLSGATWDMHNTFGIRTNAYVPGYATFNNQGILTQSSGIICQLAAAFNNSGSVDVKAGNLYLGTQVRGTPIGTSTSTGSFLGETGTTLIFFGPQTFTASSSIVADSVRFNLDEVDATVAGSFSANNTQCQPFESNLFFTGNVGSVGALEVDGSSVNFSPSSGPVTLSLSSLTLNRGTLLGADSFVLNGLFTWQDSTLGVSGSVTANGGMAITVASVGGLRLNGTTLNNAGAATLTATLPDDAYLEAGNNAVINNLSGGTWDMQNTFGIRSNGYVSGNATFNNQGILTKSSGAGPTFVLTTCNNSGTIEVKSGTLATSIVQTAGSTILDGGRISGGVNIQGGVLSGSGTVSGNVSNSGQVDPGFSPGLVNVQGNYAQTSSGDLSIELGGLTPGTQYDQLEIQNGITLNGALYVSLINGFTPNPGDTFTIIKNDPSNPISCTFANLPEGAILSVGSHEFQISYHGGNGNDVVLTAIVQEPPIANAGGPYTITYGGSLTLNASGSSDPDGDPLTYSWTINGHANAAVGATPTLSWSQLQALGVTSAQPFGVSVQVNDGFFITPQSTSVTVNQAPLAITANSASKIYGSPNPTFTVTYASLVGGDIPASLGGTLSFTTTATITSPVGAYPITPSGLTSPNYKITFVPGTLTVTLAASSVYVLNQAVSGALTASGNAAINLPNSLTVDSSSASAISASGNAKIAAAGGVLVAGGVQKSGNASVTKTGAPGATGDPLANLIAPTPPSYTGTPIAENLSGDATATISQGLYSQITVSGNAKLTLNPGVYVIGAGGVSVTGNATLSGSGVTYIIKGGGFTVSGNAGISGSSVLIVNGGSNYPNPAISGETYGGVTLSGNGSFSLNAAGSGIYAGVLVYQARDNTRAVAMSGNAMAGMTGLIYAPSALMTLSGNASLQNPLVVGTLNLSGNVTLTQTVQGSGIGAADASGIADTLIAGNLYVYVSDPNGYFTSDELARVQDTIAGLDALLAPYNVTITQVSDPALANLTLDTGTTSAAGSASGGVLGCFNGAAGEITILQGWSWYAGADATQIGAGQYDFQTTITHEFGHALGLGHVADPNSPMYESLATGTAHRVMTVADLNIPLPPVGADPLLAAPRPAKGYAGPGLVQGINLAPATAAAFVITPVTTSGPAPLSMKQAHLPSGDRSAAFVPLGVTDAGWRDVAAGSAEDAELWPGVAEEWLPPVTQPAGAVPAVKPFDDVAQGWPHTSSAENPNAEREICTNAVDSAFAWMADDMDDYEW